MINNIRIYSDPNDIERKYYKRTITIDTFTQPTLIKNGILGGDFFAVYASEEKHNYDAYHAFDSKGWYARTYTADFILYNPNSFCITELTLSYTHGHGTLDSSCYIKEYTLYGSNDNNNWIEIDTHNHSSMYSTITDTINNTNFYKYYKMICNNNSDHNHYVGMSNLIITATEKVETITESTSSDYDFYKDYRKYSLMPEQENIYYKYTNWTQPLLTSNNSSSEMWLEDPHLTGAVANYNNGNNKIETWGTSALSSFSNVYKALDSDTNNFFNPDSIYICSPNEYYAMSEAEQAITDAQQIYSVIDICFSNYMKITNGQFSCIFVDGYHCALIKVIIYLVNEDGSLSQQIFKGQGSNTNTTFSVNMSSNNTKTKRLRVCLKPGWNNNGWPCQINEITFTGQKAIKSTSSNYDFYETVNKYYTLRI